MRLHEYLAEWRGRRFEPGRADCAQFVRAWVRETAGIDLFEGIDYASIPAGLAILRRRGLGSHVDVVARALTEIPVSLAHEGDVAVIDAPDGEALALIGGEHVFALGKTGLSVAPRRLAKRAFSCRF